MLRLDKFQNAVSSIPSSRFKLSPTYTSRSNRPFHKPVKHRRYPVNRRKRVTIAAGFAYRDGILLCSDTQLTVASGKMDGTKLGTAHPSWGTVMAACAGNADFAAGAFQTCIRDTWDCKSRDALRKISESLEEHYRRHVFDHPLFENQPGEYEYSLLIALRFKGDDRARLYTTHETVMRENGAFECIGIGGDVASQMIRFLYDIEMEESYTIGLASHVLKYVKNTVEGCGGGSVIRLLRHDQTFEEGVENCRLARHVDSCSNHFVREAEKLIIDQTRGNITDFEHRLALLNAQALKYRFWWDNPTEVRRSDPGETTHGPSDQQPLQESPEGSDES
jgi:20S proteasome alpha/beta subunit